MPYPESALNEEAGKLLLERYDDYCARAKLYTEIHAKSSHQSKPSTSTSSASASGSNPSQDEASANKKACNVSLKKKDKVAKDKKKTLKRL